MVEQTDQAGALLSALMDIAEAEQGVLSLALVPCDLSRLAAEVCDMYSFVAEERNISINLDVKNPAVLRGDPVRLRQVLGNLLDNAIKYGPDGGQVDIHCNADSHRCWADVVDDGPGVAEQEISRVFDRLYRGDRSRGSRGLGLGLSMVKALVEAHHGEVTVSRESGRGAVFRVSFPIITEE